MKRAIKELLEAIEGLSLPPEELRAVRAVHVLELTATPTAARGAEDALSSGEPEARLTREAKWALAAAYGPSSEWRLTCARSRTRS